MTLLACRIRFSGRTAWAAVTLNCFIPRIMPGTPVDALINRYQGQMSTDAIASLNVLFGMNDKTSTFQQYLHYWSLLLHGDLGLSFAIFLPRVASIVPASLP